ncbi:MAG: tripartite tricarboxylate transporter TctB family protein [Clostridia bacterium]|nr:tripartite tricarboxylate transporter TctB family protein [Clostridia bacterium]
MRRSSAAIDLMEGVVFGAIALAVLLYSRSLSGILGLSMSPGLFPAVSAVALLFVSVLLIAEGARAGKAGPRMTSGEGASSASGADGSAQGSAAGVSPSETMDWKGIVIVFVTSLIYVWLIPRISFTWASVLYLFAFLYEMGERRWTMMAVVALGSPWVLYFIFSVLLKVALP